MVCPAGGAQARAQEPGAAISRARHSVRRLDHLNFFAVDIPGARRFYMDKLGMRMTEQILFESGEQAIWLTCSNKSYEISRFRSTIAACRAASIT